MLFNGTAYGYIYNLQGDVAALVNTSGTKVVTYRYDAWGRVLSKAGTMASTLGTVQPFRYRGYVWDEETGLYYLRSRYYRPEWGRFVSADTTAENGNLYCYTTNKVISVKDSDGSSTRVALNEAYQSYLLDRNSEVTFLILLSNNPGNFYLAFHEMAQILAAAELHDMGYYTRIELEEPILNENSGRNYESDISCFCMDGIEVYEVKPYGKSGIGQVNRYVNGSQSHIHGSKRLTGKEFSLPDGYKMKIESSPAHNEVIWYSFWNDNRRKENVRVLDWALKIAAAAGLIFAVANDITGVGAADDALIPVYLYTLAH